MIVNLIIVDNKVILDKYFLLSIKNMVIFFIVGLLVLPICAISQEESQNAKKRIARVLSMSVYKKVDRASELILNENYDGAEQKLNELLNKKLKPYDKAKIYQLFASVHIGKSDYKSAVIAGEKSLATEALGYEEKIQMINRMFYLYYSLENYDKAISYLNEWLSLESVLDVDVYFTAARLYAIVENMSQAINYAQQGMSLIQDNPEIEIREDWYRLLIAIQMQLKAYEDVRHTLEVAIVRWPMRANYYRQLSGVYQELKLEKESLAILSLAYKNHLIDGDSDIERLVNQYRYHKYPSKGAEIFALAIERNRIEASENTWETLSHAWMQAREWRYSEMALFKAAELASGGEHWASLCQIAFEDERWSRAHQHCKKALDKGQLDKQEASTWYLLALSQYYDSHLDLARESFERCSQWDSMKNNCEYWQRYIAELVQGENYKG